MATAYVLIIFFGFRAMAIQEFNTKETCDAARQAVMTHALDTYAICTPK